MDLSMMQSYSIIWLAEGKRVRVDQSNSVIEISTNGLLTISWGKERVSVYPPHAWVKLESFANTPTKQVLDIINNESETK